MHTEQTIETKVAAPASDVGSVFDDMMRTLGEYRDTNDRRLAELEKKMTSDVVTTEKLQRLDRVLDRQQRLIDELALKSSRPALAASEAPVANREIKQAFEAYVRRGVEPQISLVEAKALSATSQTEGSVLIPRETEAAVNRSLRDVSPLRAISDVRQVTTGSFVKPYATSDLATGWVSETAARPQTANPQLTTYVFPTMELYAMPAASQTMLDDSAVDIDTWLAGEVQAAFAIQEGQAFVLGDGVARPKGFLSYPTVAANAWTQGSLGFITTGTAGALPASGPADKLIDLTFTLKAGYRANARFVMSRATVSSIRKIKDTTGQYIWQPSLQAGQPSTLLGYPVTECEDMPGIAPDAFAIAFGDFKRGYLVIDRNGINLLRDPYTAKPFVLFYTTKRVGGGVQDFDAIKLLKFSA